MQLIYWIPLQINLNDVGLLSKYLFNIHIICELLNNILSLKLHRDTHTSHPAGMQTNYKCVFNSTRYCIYIMYTQTQKLY